MIEFKNKIGHSKLRIASVEKQYDSVVNLVYYDLFIDNRRKSNHAKYDAEEKDFLRLRDLLILLIDSSNDIFPLVFNPRVNARFELYIERTDNGFKLEARVYSDNYEDYNEYPWEMDKDGLTKVIDQINETFQ